MREVHHNVHANLHLFMHPKHPDPFPNSSSTVLRCVTVPAQSAVSCSSFLFPPFLPPSFDQKFLPPRCGSLPHSLPWSLQFLLLPLPVPRLPWCAAPLHTACTASSAILCSSSTFRATGVIFLCHPNVHWAARVCLPGFRDWRCHDFVEDDVFPAR